MPLKIDFTTDKIIKEIQAEIKKERGEDISYDLVVKCIEQQLRSTVDGFANGYTIVWKYFGTFVATKKRVDALNNKYKKLGIKQTLQDYGLVRMSLDLKGNIKSESEITPDRKTDLDVKGQYNNRWAKKI